MVRHSTTFPDSPTESMTKSMLPPVANVETSGESSIHGFPHRSLVQDGSSIVPL